MEHLNPRTARVVALGKPTERDRSWYDRAGVERVMGFATDEQYDEFMRQAPRFEQMLAESGVHVTKFWFSVTRSEQRTRFIIRQVDPVRQWKLSPIDLQSLGKWDDYTVAKERMFRQTTRPTRPGPPSSPTTRSAPASTRCAPSWPSSSTPTRTTSSSERRTRCSWLGASPRSATERSCG
jgi:polyphosphate kinase 2 (PPK2 family)